MQLKIFLLALGVTGLVTATPIAAPNPHGTTDMITGVLLFDDINYGGTTTFDPVPDGQCYTVPPILYKKISSFKLPPKVGCTFWTVPNCQIPDGVGVNWFNQWWDESVSNLKKEGVAFQDSLISFECVRTP